MALRRVPGRKVRCKPGHGHTKPQPPPKPPNAPPPDTGLGLLARVADALERTATALEALVKQGEPRIPVSMTLRVGAPTQEF